MANGTLKVSNIETSSGSGTITIGQSGETVTIPSGIMSGQNYPAFAADQQTNVTDFFSDNVITKVTFEIEQFDTDSAFDLSNNKFTVPSGQAGKYFFYVEYRAGNSDDASLDDIGIYLYKNGATAGGDSYNNAYASNYPKSIHMTHTEILDLAAGDYIELYGRFDGTSSRNGNLSNARFGGFKLGT